MRFRFGDAEADRYLEEQAQEAAWYDQFNGTIPEAGHCLLCGERCDDLTFQGLCDRCDDLACDATIAGQKVTQQVDQPFTFTTRR